MHGTVQSSPPLKFSIIASDDTLGGCYPTGRNPLPLPVYCGGLVSFSPNSCVYLHSIGCIVLHFRPRVLSDVVWMLAQESQSRRSLPPPRFFYACACGLSTYLPRKSNKSKSSANYRFIFIHHCLNKALPSLAQQLKFSYVCA